MWSRRALDNLSDIVERAPVQARRLQENVEALVRAPFPGMYRRVEGRPGEHVLGVPPHVVFYVIEGDTLTVLQLVDSRRLREPW
jgi:plasmid stabilization system protein ParE